MRRSKPYLVLTFCWSWAFFFAALLISNGYVKISIPTWVPIVIGAFGPSLSSFYLSFRCDGRTGFRQLLKSGFAIRFSITAYLFVGLIPLATAATAYFATGGRSIEISSTLPVIFIAVFFLGGSFGEEFGWRGYLLPVLFERYKPLMAALILGFVWSAWHLPLFWIKETTQYSTPLWLYVFYILALSIQYTWIYLRTNGNLFACLLLHTFTNISVFLFPIGEDDPTLKRFTIETILNVLAAIFVLVADRLCFADRIQLQQE